MRYHWVTGRNNLLTAALQPKGLSLVGFQNFAITRKTGFSSAVKRLPLAIKTKKPSLLATSEETNHHLSTLGRQRRAFLCVSVRSSRIR